MKEVVTFLILTATAASHGILQEVFLTPGCSFMPNSEAPGDFPWVTSRPKDRIMHSSLTKDR